MHQNHISVIGKTLRTLIAIPAYNEQDNIAATLRELVAAHIDADILVVDDGSIDNTYVVVTTEGIPIVRHPINLGYGVSVQTAAKYAHEHNYSFLVWFDADGQHVATEIAKLLECVWSGTADVCIGSRFACGYRMQLMRRMGSKVFSIMVKAFSGLSLRDVTSGFQALDQRAITLCCTDAFPCEYPDANLILLYHLSGLRVVELPVKMRQRLVGSSMHGGWKSVFYIYYMCLSMTVMLLSLLTKKTCKQQ
ncbi:MAG: glycosyltransferase family 2 protein [bacterium]|nr:glycosyltransferase family 2 protein [bacterium]